MPSRSRRGRNPFALEDDDLLSPIDLVDQGHPLVHKVEILSVALPALRSVVQADLPEPAARVVNSWYEAQHERLQVPQALSSNTIRLIEQFTGNETSNLSKVAKKLCSNPVDRMLLEQALGYNLVPGSSPIERLTDSLNQLHGLSARPHCSAEVMAILAGLPVEVISPRLEPESHLRRTGLFLVERDQELHLTKKLVRWVRSGMAGDPSWSTEDHGDGSGLPGSIKEYLRDPCGLIDLLQGPTPLALQLDPSGLPEGLVREVLRKLAGELGKPLFLADPKDSTIALSTSQDAPGILAVFGKSDEDDDRPWFREDQRDDRPELSPEGHSLLWVGKPPESVRKILDGSIGLTISADQLASLLGDIARSRGVQLEDEACRRIVRNSPVLDRHGFGRAIDLAVQRPELAPEVAIRNQLGSMAQARGLKCRTSQIEVPATYDPRLVVCLDGDLERIEQAVQRPDLPGHAGRFLIGGPPGTGKSAWARYCAGLTGREVQVRRAGDFLNKYVGEFEKRLVCWFGELASTGAVGIVDESDSLLWPRSRARQSWEVSHTNELLQVVEQHPGLLLFTTNSALSNDRIDEAVLRRFIKLEFGYLDFDRIAVAFRLYFGHQAPERICLIRNLSPGDFQAVKARAQILGGLDDPDELARMLERECALKG